MICANVLAGQCPILIDQEGGRVQRLKPPHWKAYPSAQSLADQGEEALKPHMRALAGELAQSGIDVNCAPVLDVLTPLTDKSIGDRAFSDDPDIVARCGEAVCATFLSAGVTPVIKHLPGHGRAQSDSHKTLPRVSASLAELEQDFAPFRALCRSDLAPALWGMVAHVVYEAVDPDHPATTSVRVIEEVIRDSIGFDGLLLSDDLSMDALAGYGDVAQRSMAVLEAGCDVALYCAGDMEEMEKIAEICPKLSAKARKSLQKSRELRNVRNN